MTNKPKSTYKKPKQMRAYLALAWYAFRAQTRNPATFAFGFIFPIVFISIFGLIGGGSTKLTVGIVNKSDPNNAIVKTIEKQPYLSVDKEELPILENKLKQG